MSVPCDACGSTQTHPRYQNRDYISGQTFPLLECLQCGLTRTAFDPEQTSLAAYYDAAYYGAEGKRFPAPMEWAIRWFRERRVQTILSQHPQTGRILDIGCGRGLMLAEFHQRGWEAVGTEFSADLAAAVQKQHGFRVHHSQYLSDCTFPDDYFDVITLWHVLEHLPYPIQTLQEIRRILKPNGILLIEVPNIESWQAKIGGGAWFHLDCPRHLYHFGTEQLTTILQAAGLSILQTNTLSLEYGPYGALQSLLNRLTYQPNVLYARLKGVRPAPMGLAAWQLRYDDLITLTGLPLAVLLGFAWEALAVLKGQGGIVQIIGCKN